MASRAIFRISLSAGFRASPQPVSVRLALGVSPHRHFHRSSKLPEQSSTPSRQADIDNELTDFRKLLEKAKLRSRGTINVTDIEAPHTGVIRILGLNRPQTRNALNTQMVQELDEEVESIHAQGPSGDVRVLVVASESNESFCAGADLKERKSMSQDEVTTFLAHLRRTFTRLSDLPIPSLSVISGTALGGGLELALCTHIRYLSPSASLALPETRLGIIPGAGGTYRLPSIVGTSYALEMVLSGRRVGAVEAWQMGLGKRTFQGGRELDRQKQLDISVERELALKRTVDAAMQVAQGAPLALAAALRAMKGPGGPSEVAENVAYDSLLHTEDRKEALAAFAEKRMAAFKGC